LGSHCPLRTTIPTPSGQGSRSPVTFLCRRRGGHRRAGARSATLPAGWAARRAAGPGWTGDRAVAVAAASVVRLAVGFGAIAAIHGPTDPVPFTPQTACVGRP